MQLKTSNICFNTYDDLGGVAPFMERLIRVRQMPETTLGALIQLVYKSEGGSHQNSESWEPDLIQNGGQTILGDHH